MAEQMILEGELQKTALPRVLQHLTVRGSTGILTIQGEEDIVAVSYLKGNIVAADALNQTVENGLGKILAQQKLVKEDEFATIAKEHQGGSSGSLGDLLVSRELITREQLLDALRLQTFRLMLQVLTWRQGEYKFYGGDEVSFEEGVSPISIAELLMRALDELGERSGVGGEIPKLNAVYRRVPPHGQVQVFGRDGEGSGGGIWITEQQESFLVQTDGSASAVAIAKANGMGRFQTLFCLHQLLERDLIEVAAVGRPAARPAPGRAAPARPAPSPPAAGATVASPAIQSRTAGPAAPSVARPAPAQAEAPRPAPPPPGRPAPTSGKAQPADDEGAAGEVPAFESPAAVHPWIGPCLGLLLIGFLVLALAYRPGAYLQPFPWQETSRSIAERQVRQSLFLEIDTIAHSYFLKELHYPDALEELIGLDLLSEIDLRDPSGYALSYESDHVNYKILLMDGDKSIEGLGTSRTSTGDFLLDPTFTIGGEDQPIRLLD